MVLAFLSIVVEGSVPQQPYQGDAITGEVVSSPTVSGRGSHIGNFCSTLVHACLRSPSGRAGDLRFKRSTEGFCQSQYMCTALPAYLWPFSVIFALLCTGCRLPSEVALDAPLQTMRARAPAHWSIGFLEGPTIFSMKERAACANPRITSHDVRSHESEFVADPFLVRESNKWFLFFETFNRESNKGEIAVAESEDLCSWRYGGVVLSERFHLSYPNVFKHNGTYVMVPESKQASEVRLYRALSFPHTWKYERTLIREALADPTLLEWKGRWWIFGNRAPYSLALFSAGTLAGRYVEHPGSPLFIGEAGRARPAGSVLVVDGKPLRFVQDNRLGYGKRVRMVSVRELSTVSYDEELREPDPFLKEQGRGWNGFGMHHVSVVRQADGSFVAAVDGNAP